MMDQVHTIDSNFSLPWGSYWYLGSPYSKYPAGLTLAAFDVARIAAAFAKRGISVYSPIAHTHPIAQAGDLDPLDHKIWLPFDEPMMRSAYGLIVAMMDSWQTSYGLKVEIDWFKSHGRPIVYLEVPPPYTPFPGVASC
jgi:hypothetical protein